MEFFTKVKAVKLRSHLDKYLAADDDKETVRQSRQGSARKARWLVEPVDGNPQLIRLKGIHGSYLGASAAPFLLGMTGNKVVQAKLDDSSETTTEWQPIRDGFQVKLKAAAGGTYLRANGGTPPWRNTVTHDIPLAGSTHNWVLWEAEAVEIPENEALNDYLSLVSSFSSLSDEVFGTEEVESPMSIRSYNSPRLSTKKHVSLNQNGKVFRGNCPGKGKMTIRVNSFFCCNTAALCNWCGTWKGDKVCSSCRRAHYCSKKHQAMHWRSGHKIECQQLNSYPQSSNTSPTNNSVETQKVASNTIWPEYKIINEDECEFDTEMSEDSKYSNSLVSGSRMDESFKSLLDNFEGDSDKKSWASFQECIAKGPEQVLR